MEYERISDIFLTNCLSLTLIIKSQYFSFPFGIVCAISFFV